MAIFQPAMFFCREKLSQNRTKKSLLDIDGPGPGPAGWDGAGGGMTCWGPKRRSRESIDTVDGWNPAPVDR